MTKITLPRWNAVQWTMVSLIALIAVALILSVLTSSFAVNDDGRSGSIDGSECLSAIMEAAAIPADQDANEPLIRSAFECETVDEWVAAVSKYPSAMGLADPSMIDPEYDLMGICGEAPQAPVCVDAARLGLDTYWGG